MVRHARQLLLAASAACVMLLFPAGGSPALAASGAPGWTVSANAFPTNFAPGQPGDIEILARNAGSQASTGTVTITDELPAGLMAESVKGEEQGYSFAFGPNNKPPAEMSCAAHGQVVTCLLLGAAVVPGGVLSMDVGVSVSPATPEGQPLANSVLVQGGGALPVRTGEQVPVDSKPAGYGLQSFNFQVANAAGQTDQQAGDRPYETNVSYFLNSDRITASGERPGSEVSQAARDFVFDLPPGLVGNPQVIDKCPLWRADDLECPLSTQVGVAMLFLFDHRSGESLVENTSIEPIYNVEPEPGEPAEFQFDVEKFPVALHVTVSPETGDAVRVSVLGVPRVAGTFGVMTTFFGEPLNDPDVYDHSVGANPVAFLTNPVDCAAGPLTASMYSDSWQNPGSFLPDGAPDLADPAWKTLTSTVYPSMTGCDALQFQPTIQVAPNTTQADEQSGVSVDVHVPQAPDASPDLLTPELRDATVTLPAGLTVSPSAADGLQACSDGQFDEASAEPVSCPNASVLGTVLIKTPLLEAPLEGQVFLASPECDPCSAADMAEGRELRIFLEAYGLGVRIKREGRVYANPSTGQLTTKFVENPELPFENLELHFKGGLRAGLATPQACGPATTTADFSPWSAPITPDAIPISSFDVDWNGEGEACPTAWPFAPSFSAGTSNPNAGQFSPFTLTFARDDREQDLAQIQVHMPPGLLGKLSGVALCGEPQAAQGTCPEASRIGSMTVAAGAGAHPFYEKGEIYLTGPYEGAPFGLSIVVPTVAGPFNLGNVVVRSQIAVNPETTALTVTSDPFPQIIDGIPLRLRTANVTIERPEFMFNPSNCERLAITATIASAQGAQAHVSAPFAVSGCAGLPFDPKFSVSTSGRTSKADGASLTAKLVWPKGAQSNIAKVKVDLPKQLPSRLTTLQKACLAATFDANPAACPAASAIGMAKAITPVLPVPLTGPVYFVSHGGEAFPSLIVVLQGYGVRVDLVASTFISKAGITSSTFSRVPDDPVESFELYLPQGPHSALAANGNPCTSKLVMPTSFVAQDGAQLKQNTRIAVTGCPKTKKKTKTKKKAKRARASTATRHGKHGGGAHR